jgi:hypothetical protein
MYNGVSRMRCIVVLAVALIGIQGLVNPAIADTRDSVLAAATRCNSITDLRMWLDCYYGAAQPMRALLGLPPAPVAQTHLVPEESAVAPAHPTEGTIPSMPPQLSQDNSGGILKAIRGGDTLVNKVPAASYRFDKKGIFTITLSNGEVWQQLANDDVLAHWSGPASRYLVTIKEGWFGSHNLEVQADHGRYKVRRVY